uniref:Uncharacterized protein n=1 Tax=Minutocellus polymorphus TaxID=265543 RepID=A0A7S0AZU4_9STRA|mmetsp:Transcript_7554/g.12513  ORF Transcript_7554/g.12513 Transcript_7554/m.12513 type:complete len:225 (+) Transcript_7554:171-845(+)
MNKSDASVSNTVAAAAMTFELSEVERTLQEVDVLLRQGHETISNKSPAAAATDGSKIVSTAIGAHHLNTTSNHDSITTVVDFKDETAALDGRPPLDHHQHESAYTTTSDIYLGLLCDDIHTGDEEANERRQNFAAKRRRLEGKITFPSYYNSIFAEVTAELAAENDVQRQANEDRRQEHSQALPSSPAYITSRNNERHHLALAAELLAEMDDDEEEDSSDDDWV